jgi:AhpD family alkylhydroperoxidase
MTHYPEHRAELNRHVARLGKEIAGTVSAFGSLRKAAMSAGTIDPKTKELIALGISIALRCDGCIAYHLHDALAAGASRQEILETVGVAIVMGGGPAVVYGAQVSAAVEQFEAQGEK